MALTDVTSIQQQYGNMFSPYGDFNTQAQNMYNNTIPAYAYNQNNMGNYTAYSAAQAMFPEVPYIEPAFDQRQKIGMGQMVGMIPQAAMLGKQLFGKEGLIKGKGVSNLVDKIRYAGPIPGSGGATQIINPVTGSEASLLPGGQMPAGFELAPSKFAAASKSYYGNLMAGKASAAIPTYLAGRLVRSAFDDDDPTTFTGGEMLGAGISGAGAGAFIGAKVAGTAVGTALTAKLGMAAGPIGALIGIGISLLGGKKKRDKARKAARAKAQREYEEAVAQRKQEIRDAYLEGIERNRQAQASQFQAQQYYQSAARYGNTYGTTQYSEGGLLGHVPEYNELTDDVPEGEGIFDFLSSQEKEEFGFGGFFRRRKRKRRKKKKKGFFKKLKGKIKKTIKKIKKGVKKVGKKVGKVAKKVVKTGAKVAKKVVKTGAKVVKQGVKVAKKVVTKVAKVAKKVVTTGIKVAKDAVKFVGKGVKAVVKGVGDVVKGVVGGVKDLLGGRGKEEPLPKMEPLPTVPEAMMQSPLIPAAMGVGANQGGVGPGFTPRVVSGGPNISGGSAGFAQRMGQDGIGFYQQNQLGQ
tara:strand:+ start:619 stop:2349 length:1731 start_codon:yes stop_codon:yes gene_type:complete